MTQSISWDDRLWYVPAKEASPGLGGRQHGPRPGLLGLGVGGGATRGAIARRLVPLRAVGTLWGQQVFVHGDSPGLDATIESIAFWYVTMIGLVIDAVLCMSQGWLVSPRVWAKTHWQQAIAAAPRRMAAQLSRLLGTWLGLYVQGDVQT